MRQSQTGPFDSSFCFVVLTKKTPKQTNKQNPPQTNRKTTHSRPIIHRVTGIGSNMELGFLYLGLLRITPGKPSPFKTDIVRLWHFHRFFFVPGYPKTAQPWL